MFDKIEKAIIKVLQDHLKTIPKDNIGRKKPKFDENLPAISLTNVDFEIKEVGVGRAIGGGGKEFQDTFSGDGKRKEFTLTEKPLRPHVTVEHPPGKRLEDTDFTIDYEKGIINFHSPPEKGKNNILIRYIQPATIKGLRLNLRYHLNVWAGDETQRDAITVEVIEALFKEEKSLNRQGIFIHPTRGFNTPSDGDVPEGVYGKTVEYLVETDLKLVIPLPRIEEIEVQKV